MNKINNKHIDIIKEFVNIGMGKSANILNQMIGCHITLKVPSLKIIEGSQLKGEFDNLKEEILASVNIPFSKGVQGMAKLVFPSSSASKLVDIFIGNLNEGADIEDMDVLRMSALTEIGNIIINTVIGTIGNYTDVDISYSIPDYVEGNIEKITSLDGFDDAHMVLLCIADFRAAQIDISGNLILFFRIDKFDDFLQILEKHYQNIVQQ